VPPPVWPARLGRVRPWLVHYLAWDGATARQAWIVLPSGWGPDKRPPLSPLVISPHGRNNLGWTNAVRYWQELPADGPFILICPDGLGRAHDKASDPFNQPPSHPGLFTYAYPKEIDDLARMPHIVQETLPWLRVDMKRIYVLGSSMGGQETLMLAARYPRALAGGTGRLAGAAAFDSPCDMPRQCAYLTNRSADSTGNPAAVAALMLDEIGSKPSSTARFDKTARFFNSKTRAQMTIGELLAQLPRNQALWNERSALSHVDTLASLRFPLRLYWSTKDVIVGNQVADQSGKLYRAIRKANPSAKVAAVEGTWAHSAEFVPNGKLGQALGALGVIEV
jgi:pimeloyl-ACP methyl ester carboxylesterase